MSSRQHKHEPDARLRIGAVSRLTDLSVHVLRKWEKRYGAVEPLRTPAGGRLYTRSDVQRLALIKQLTQAGAALSEVARSSLSQLEELAETMLRTPAIPTTGTEPPATVRLGVVGDALPTRLQAESQALDCLDLVAFARTAADLNDTLEGEEIDLLVRELPTVHDGVAVTVNEAVKTTGARGAIVVYGFGAREALQNLRDSGIAVMRAPIDPVELQHVALGLMQQLTGEERRAGRSPSAAPSDVVPPPRFSQKVVARVAISTPTIRCECPHHLADIISNLSAFERYSLECENRNAHDAKLHRFLAVTAGRSRAAFEDALVEIAKAEGIDLSA